MKKQIRNKIKSLFKESLSFNNADNKQPEDPYGAGPCPHCGEFAIGTMRHKGSPVSCKNNHFWKGTCSCHPNTPVETGKAYWGGKDGVQEDKLPGGEADDMTLKDIAKSHEVPVSNIKNQFKQGKEHEAEHTNDEEIAGEIAKDHLGEVPDYYKQLKDAGIDEQKLNEMPYFNDIPDKNGQPLDLQIEKWSTEEDLKKFLIKLFSTEFYNDEKQPSIEITNPEEFVKILTNYDGDVTNPTTQFFIQFIRKYKANGRKITTNTVVPEDIEYVKRFVIDAYNKSKEYIS